MCFSHTIISIMAEKLSTEPYKGVRDFYPEDMAIQQHIFDVWSKTAESFGFQRYDASVLEPSELYKSKGAENEELVNEQTYTFLDRGNREVTLRPEMTPTVARMIASRHKELSFPARWYSIPNLFRYERAQRGRVREHWQLNCDMFGSNDISSDVEMISLAHSILINFGANPEMFTIKVNHKRLAAEVIDYNVKKAGYSITEDQINKVIRLTDKIEKIAPKDFERMMTEIVGEGVSSSVMEIYSEDREGFLDSVHKTDSLERLLEIMRSLREMGIKIEYDPTLVRGFDYYTGLIFEIFDNNPNNNRSMLGGGRYDNLTSLFGDEAIGGIGFGMGDVTMRDFLETHDLLPRLSNSASVVVIPTEASLNLEAEKVARSLRKIDLSVMVDISTRKLGKKIASADSSGAGYVLIVGEDEVTRNEFVLKNLADGTETSGTIERLAEQFVG